MCPKLLLSHYHWLPNCLRIIRLYVLSHSKASSIIIWWISTRQFFSWPTYRSTRDTKANVSKVELWFKIDAIKAVNFFFISSIFSHKLPPDRSAWVTLRPIPAFRCNPKFPGPIFLRSPIPKLCSGVGLDSGDSEAARPWWTWSGRSDFRTGHARGRSDSSKSRRWRHRAEKN